MDWENKEEVGFSKDTRLPLSIAIGLVALILAIGIGSGFGEKIRRETSSVQVVSDEYVWFVEQAELIQDTEKNIALCENNVANIDTEYLKYGMRVDDWPPSVQMEYRERKDRGKNTIKAIIVLYNDLVRLYNKNSANFDWSPHEAKPDKPPEYFREYAEQRER